MFFFCYDLVVCLRFCPSQDNYGARQ